MYGPAVRCKRFRRSGVSGLASMYPVSDWSMCSGPSWYQRACVLINGQVSTDHSGHQCSHALGRPNLHLVSSSRRPRLETVDRGYVIACSSYRAVPVFEPRAVPSSRSAERRARREDQAGRTPASSVLVSSKARPLASTAQAMRASLLASAIASTLWCNRLLAASIQDLSP